jgi:hypothetical protein
LLFKISVWASVQNRKAPQGAAISARLFSVPSRIYDPVGNAFSSLIPLLAIYFTPTKLSKPIQPREEVVIVPLVGRGKLLFNGQTHELARKDLFRELADIVYLPEIPLKSWPATPSNLKCNNPRSEEALGSRLCLVFSKEIIKKKSIVGLANPIILRINHFYKVKNRLLRWLPPRHQASTGGDSSRSVMNVKKALRMA